MTSRSICASSPGPNNAGRRSRNAAVPGKRICLHRPELRAPSPPNIMLAHFGASALLAYWVHEPHPFLGPHWGNVGVRYYGLGYLFGFLAAAWLLARYARKG